MNEMSDASDVNDASHASHASHVSDGSHDSAPSDAAKRGVLRVGLTGGIASGKTTVARHLASRGIPVLDADRVVRSLYAPGGAGVEAVVRLFGPRILSRDGSIDRPALASVAFADPAAVASLNAAVHPLVHAEEERWLASLAERGERLGVVEATLLLESGGRERYDVVVTVSAPQAERLARALARDPGRSEAETRSRMAAQLPDAGREEAADVVLVNDGDLEALRRKADSLADALLDRAGAGGAGAPRDSR